MVFNEINEDNFPRIASIYKEGIETGTATFETRIPPYEEWDYNHLKFGRIVLLENKSIVGWAALSKVSNRIVYKGVAEVSVYVARDVQGKGVGRRLLMKLIEISEVNGIWTLQSGIMCDNLASIRLHRSCGFREIGYRERIGLLNGIWCDNVIMERRSDCVGV